MKIVPADEHPIDVAYDLTHDVSNYLMGYLSQTNLAFDFGGEQLYLNEVFMIHGGLCLFLFDNEEAIKEYCNNKKNSDGHNLHIETVFIQKETETFFGFYPKIKHNLVCYNPYNINTNMYYDFIHYLSKHILQQKELVIQDNKIMLEALFDKMTRKINQHKEQNIGEKQQLPIDNHEEFQSNAASSIFKNFKKRKTASRKINKNDKE